MDGSFNQFVVGERVCSPGPEGMTFDLDSSGALLIAKFSKPTNKEIQAYKCGTFQVRIAQVHGVLFFLSRFGDLQWTDAPYYSRLSQYVLQRPAPSQGLSLTVLLVDAETGTLKALRVIGLSTAVSNLLLDMATQQPDLGNRGNYLEQLTAIYRHYTTDDLLACALEVP